MNIYVASSWRNVIQPAVVKLLRELGHKVYDFRHPSPGDDGFRWADIDPEWRHWSPAQFAEALKHPLAQAQFDTDIMEMEWADACVLVLPCGRSAHLEAGWFLGAGKPCIAFIPEDIEPELLYSMMGFENICWSTDGLREALKREDDDDDIPFWSQYTFE